MLAIQAAVLSMVVGTTVGPDTIVVDGPGHPCAWQVEGGQIRRVVDEGSGQQCLEWFASPAVKLRLVHEFPRRDLDRFDCLYVRWKFAGGGVGITARLDGYPTPERRRRWYLFKQRYLRDRWREAWLDLRMDDDNGNADKLPPGKMRLVLELFNRPRKTPDEKDWRRVRIAAVKFLRHPVRPWFDWREVTFPSTPERIATVYPIHLESRLDRPARVRLLADTTRLFRFALELPKQPIALGPRAKRVVEVRLTMPAAGAGTLEPLYSEPMPLYVTVDGVPDSRVALYLGQTRRDLVGVVPPRRKRPYFHPPGQRERILSVVKRYDWAKRWYENLIRSADAGLKHTYVLADLVHGYSGHYTCRKHRCTLQSRGPGKHWCHKGKHFVTGDPRVEAAGALQLHTAASKAVHTLGQAWFLTGNKAYARKGASICLAYADRYLTYPLVRTDTSGYMSRVAHAVLGESWWLHGLNLGYDEIAASGVLSAPEQRKIERRLLLEAAINIQTHRISKNQQAEINCASGLAALNAGHWALAANVWSGEYGLKDQIELTYDADGFSLETDMGYHFAALMPMLEQGLAYQSLGASFFTPRLKRVFDAPMAYRLDQNVGYVHVYEAGYRHFRDPVYLPLVHQARRRAGVLSVTEGVLDLPPAPTGSLPSRTLTNAGYTILRHGAGEHLSGIQMWWGGPRSRGVPGYLTYTLTFQRVPLNDHVERIAYGYRECAFSYNAVANNTVVVDGANHVATPPKQAAMLTTPWPAGQWVCAPGASLAPGVAVTRSVAMIGHTFVMIDQLRSDRAHRYDWVFYPNTKRLDKVSATSQPYAALTREGKGYQWLLSPLSWGTTDGAKPVTIQYVAQNAYGARKAKSAPVVFQLEPVGQKQHLLSATGLLHWHPIKRPVVILRRRVANTCFIATWRLRRPKGGLDSHEVLPASATGRRLDPSVAVAVRVSTDRGVFTLVANGSAQPVSVGGRSVGAALAVLEK